MANKKCILFTMYLPTLYEQGGAEEGARDAEGVLGVEVGREARGRPPALQDGGGGEEGGEGHRAAGGGGRRVRLKAGGGHPRDGDEQEEPR